MFTLQIEHPVSDHVTWQQAFAGFAAARRDAGVLAERVGRPVDVPAHVVVALDFAKVEQAQAFHGFLRTVVWANPDHSPALAGEPVVRIFEGLPQT